MSIAEPEIRVSPGRTAARIRSIDEIKEIARGRIAASRYEREVGGVEVGGIKIRTDRESQALLSGAVLRLSADQSLQIDWKGENGWVKLSYSDVMAMSVVVGNHVQACFSAEKAKNDELDALTTYAELREFDPKVSI